ncbi:MAG: type IX secretion system sortase PorU [Balneolaceae bacterium]|nr:type IX secretion system sortase PorU [Balneolaceae bacterium]MBO6546984.1 type IX secretion system sortase PorU [Balneolaceae bacterium]MBO6649344.1 type IX secretion system sortase PorU [Balneolaceae bacterium]
MFQRFSYICFFSFLFLFAGVLSAQELRKVAVTDSYTEYEIINNDSGIYPSYEFMVPIENGSARYEIINQSVFSIKETISDAKKIALNLSSSESPVAEITNPGMYRGQEVASLQVHLTRYSSESILLTEHIRFRVYKVKDEVPFTSVKRKNLLAVDHPLSTGTWFKIPIGKRGIYQLNANYLSQLGIDVDSIDPRNIQLWGTDGYVLPESNSAERPEFSQIPILVEGENDGSFDTNDKVIFYGNSPHQESRSGNSFSHDIHPYSDSNYVFLSVANSLGDRVSVVNSGLTASRTITSFDDFVWKEQELTKTETKQKSGRYWLGQTIPATAANQIVNVFQDTLPDVDTSVPVRLSGQIYLRAVTTTAFELNFNNNLFRSFSISRLTQGYGSYEFESARRFIFTNSTAIEPTSDGILSLDLMMKNTDSGANAFIDYFGLVVRRQLTAKNNQLFFFAPFDGEASEIVDYRLRGFSNTPYAMDVSNPTQPGLLNVTSSNGDYSLIYNSDPETKVMAQATPFIPVMGSQIANQNLHGVSSYPDYIIITSETFLDIAQELANHRAQRDNLTPLVVTQNQVLNEFSSGVKDPTAIRDFLKHLWDVAVNDGETPPKYLLLFGDATYDTKNVIANSFTNHILTYQTAESIHRTQSYGSDDYFGLMDDSEGELNRLARVDLGIGRISAQSRSEAAIMLDKIRRYEDPANDGDWQNLFTFAADDDLPDPERNRDLHVENADGTVQRMNLNQVGGRVKKIYLFDYPEEITGAGRQLPAATRDFINTINSGTLVTNYSGHGNAQNLTDEELYSSDYISQLTNRNRLTLFVTATCQFGRYDDINAQSGAEKLVFADNGGAVASFTTTRVVYTGTSTSSLNYGLNIELSQNMLERNEDGESLTFGEIYLRTKNTRVGSEENNRKFILIGDPALKFALPDKNAQVEVINGIDVASEDTVLTIKALDQVTLSGGIRNADGDIESDFNGEVVVTLFDAPRTVNIPTDRVWYDEPSDCYLNSNTDRECTYKVENDILFKGKTLAENGIYELTFIIPKDISFSDELGRVVVYAKNGQTTASGAYTDVIFNGLNTEAVDDGKGPELDVYLNDQTFINGSLANDSPNLIVELSDSSGINTTGTGVGHEIIATIDTKPQQTFVLNDFFEGTLNDYTSGRIEYPLENIPEGNYALKVRAWDVHNNPSEQEVFFQVADQEDLVVDNIYNYPNPMNNVTSFTFEHNQQGNPLDVDIRIYTLSGKPVHRIEEYIPPTNTLSSYASIPWNGRDRDNDRLGNGTYIYVLRVATDTPEGRKATEKIEKLVIIR